MIYSIIKRIIDFIGAFILLIIISPLFFILALIVRSNLGSPIFFKQQRTGLHTRVFNIMKFRTMTDEKDVNGNLLPDHLRVTKFGRFLRSSSLDELPELINILNGDMSFVGPRPLPSEYNNFYKSNEMSRFEVRGGLVPPDSVDNSPIISWNKQLEYEANYAKKVSLLLDMKIIFNAFRIVLSRNNSDYGSFERKALCEERKDLKK